MLDKIENMSEDELGEIMGGIFSLIPLVLKNMNPVRAARVVKLAMKETGKAKELAALSRTSDKIDKGIDMAADILAFRREHSEDFEKVLDMLEDVVGQYYADPKMKQKILGMIK
ncbi:MAG: hypothetical protein IKQ61_08385 [Spirochaetales bacterium]|nr:hypothetical protein [Spirochaetales bacterium]